MLEQLRLAATSARSEDPLRAGTSPRFALQPLVRSAWVVEEPATDLDLGDGLSRSFAQSLRREALGVAQLDDLLFAQELCGLPRFAPGFAKALARFSLADR